ncbi:methionine ABC transporter substrate-binding protein MetQ [Paraphotobacterium marinum]|uniref:Methionine ABC transporter substrate-binding protein MetQ n=1 Tax=Paraphotobacterium marinum TaxID=1755811 RepID=A0A220VBN8_9GAMM|nr:MetQ/NlpA family lipoprotein [Paraphotobacterium marinum]ASK77807.1 methionine ABC transporter substrate-binding protein MetQ [Paraphotobacterium marinum]
MKSYFKILFVICSIIVLSACNKKSDDKEIKVGVIAGQEADLAQVAAKVAKEKYNINVKIITFSDYNTPNIALNDGSIDVNVFQHRPYLEQQIKDHNYKFSSIGNTFIYPIAAYSNKIKNIKQISQNASIAIPNDPTNMGRALILLEKNNLIKLKPNVGLLATPMDITSNKLNLKFIPLDAAQLPRSLSDVTLAFVNNTYASQAGLNINNAIILEDKNSPYVNLIVTKTNNIKNQKLIDFVKAYQSDAVYKKAILLFHNNIVKGW